MFGLAEQIGSEILPSTLPSAMIKVGRTGQQVDADAAEQLALGLRHIGVAGADDHVYRLTLSVPSAMAATACTPPSTKIRRRRRNAWRLRWPDAAALERRRAGDDALYAGDPGRDDGHMRGGDHRIAAAWHIAANRVHRDVAVAKHDTGQRLDLEVVHGLLLLLREVSHLGLPLISSRSRCGTWAMARSISCALNLKSVGAHSSNFFDRSFTA